MKFMDMVFRQYHDPWTFISLSVRNHRLKEFVDTFVESNEEKIRWEYFLHKLGAFDDRTWEKFNSDIDGGRKIKNQHRSKLETPYKSPMTSFKLSNWKKGDKWIYSNL